MEYKFGIKRIDDLYGNISKRTAKKLDTVPESTNDYYIVTPVMDINTIKYTTSRI